MGKVLALLTGVLTAAGAAYAPGGAWGWGASRSQG